MTVNGAEHPFTPGMTVQTLLEEKGYVFPLIIVKINGQVVEDDRFASASLTDGDEVKVIHVFAGG